MARMDKRTRIGRPHKGARDVLVTRPALALGEAVRARAEREGYDSISEYIAAVLAEHEGMPDLAPRPHPAPAQEAFQIPA